MALKARTLEEILNERKTKHLEAKKHSAKLNSSLSIPSAVNSYSMSVAYIKNWFFRNIRRSTFGNPGEERIYIDESNYSDQFNRSTMIQNFIRQKPSLMIVPELDTEYDRNGLDTYMQGSNNYIRLEGLKRAFLRDPKNNVFLSMDLKLVKTKFTFRMRFNTKAEQLDMKDILELNCQIGKTQGEYVDMDFHIPYDLMRQLAKDIGFKVEDGKIRNTQEFVSYLNSHSVIPIIYKFRDITGRFEFFMRVRQNYCHISALDKIQVDQGELKGFVKSNFNLEMVVELEIPAPKFYNYFSINSHEFEPSSHIYTCLIDSIKFPDIPEQNSSGWLKLYENDIEVEDNTKPLDLDFEELFLDEDSKDILIIKEMIDNYKKMNLSPSLFIEFKLYNDGEEIDYELDWDRFNIKAKNPHISYITHLVMYTDRKCVNQYILDKDKLSDGEIKVSDKQSDVKDYYHGNL